MLDTDSVVVKHPRSDGSLHPYMTEKLLTGAVTTSGRMCLYVPGTSLFINSEGFVEQWLCNMIVAFCTLHLCTLMVL